MLPDESGDKSDIQLQENPDAIVRSYTSLSERSCMPSPLPVKGNTCIDDPDQSTDQIEDNSIEYGEIYVIELRKGKNPFGIHLVDVTSTLSELRVR